MPQISPAAPRNLEQSPPAGRLPALRRDVASFYLPSAKNPGTRFAFVGGGGGARAVTAGRRSSRLAYGRSSADGETFPNFRTFADPNARSPLTCAAKTRPRLRTTCFFTLFKSNERTVGGRKRFFARAERSPCRFPLRLLMRRANSPDRRQVCFLADARRGSLRGRTRRTAVQLHFTGALNGRASLFVFPRLPQVI